MLNVSVYINDILVMGKTRVEHLRILEEVLQLLESAGASLNDITGL